ncbi:MAG: multidrug effflux MFS transporter, partial [Oceanospirillum sp.]|nr:multidrug effflux MFS transporter [Oceanospirillum sp.]
MTLHSQDKADTPSDFKPAFAEFVALLALLMSMVALAIDAVLPAMSVIGEDFSVVHAEDLQWIVGILFAGLAFGQILYGPLSDSFGRKPAIYLGLIIFLIGSLVSAFAESYEMMLVGRFIQGIGASGPKVVAVALVRDRYAGRAMARVMSFVMAVFIIMPAIAPSIGAGVLMVADWRGIYEFFVVLSLVALIWFAIRQPETLVKEKRIPLSFGNVWRNSKETMTHKVTLGYIVGAGLIFGAFVSYLSTAQLLFKEVFQIDKTFPLYFAVLALSVGAASFMNGRLVMRFGMKLLANRALIVMFSAAVSFLVLLTLMDGVVPIGVFMLFGAVIFGCIGLLFGNMNALAMEPLGHIAGVAS